MLLRYVQRLLPRLSATERIALESGGVSVEADIFAGRMRLTNAKKASEKVQVASLQHAAAKHHSYFRFPECYQEGLKDLADNGVFGYIISKQYGGSKLSTYELSKRLTYLTSANPALGVCAMVPNSLGPGELLQKYGTRYQKETYLPKLANGQLIPCFGLTGPKNGSDAVGAIDTGVVRTRSNGELLFDVTLDKRYITLAPIANLIGIAFNIEDPAGKLVGTGIQPGVCLALIERDHPGLEIGPYHNPLDVGFPNGTVKGRITLETSHIIGDTKGIGKGWQMLMECLAEGRAVSLPACANASSKVALFGVYHYSMHRKQFNRALHQMEGVQEKLLNLLFHTATINAAVEMTNAILDSGKTPSVISAIMKYQTTERARLCLLDAMDVHAGSAIIKGPNNFLEPFYRSAPIGITVEGSNVLTRSLITYGQGLSKSHPGVCAIMNARTEDDMKSAILSLASMGISSTIRALRSNGSLLNQIERHHAAFGVLALATMKLGAKLKGQQEVLGLMADLLSNLYLIQGQLWYKREYKKEYSSYIVSYVCRRLLDDNERIGSRLVSLLGPLPSLFNANKQNTKGVNEEWCALQRSKALSDFVDRCGGDIYKSDILQKLELLSSLNPTSQEYEALLNDVESVSCHDA